MRLRLAVRGGMPPRRSASGRRRTRRKRHPRHRIGVSSSRHLQLPQALPQDWLAFCLVKNHESWIRHPYMMTSFEPSPVRVHSETLWRSQASLRSTTASRSIDPEVSIPIRAPTLARKLTGNRLALTLRKSAPPLLVRGVCRSACRIALSSPYERYQKARFASQLRVRRSVPMSARCR